MTSPGAGTFPGATLWPGDDATEEVVSATLTADLDSDRLEVILS